MKWEPVSIKYDSYVIIHTTGSNQEMLGKKADTLL